jgi:hypothetical protein
MFEVVERFPILRRIVAGIAKSSGLAQVTKIPHPNFGLVVGGLRGRAFAQAGILNHDEHQGHEGVCEGQAFCAQWTYRHET